MALQIFFVGFSTCPGVFRILMCWLIVLEVRGNLSNCWYLVVV